MDCDICGGHLGILGNLGNLTHLLCIDCGMQYSIPSNDLISDAARAVELFGDDELEALTNN